MKQLRDRINYNYDNLKGAKMKTIWVEIIALIVVAAVLILMACSKAGSEAKVIDLKITGMTCNKCVERVTKALESVPNVDTAKVDLETEQAVVEYGPDRPDIDKLLEAVKVVGYSAEVIDQSEAAR
jgi:copper chaperone CopZ